MANGTWKIARGRNSAQLPLAVFAILAVVLVLVGRAQPALFNRARAYFSDWTSPVLEAARVPIDDVVTWLGGLDGVFVVYQENQRLKEQNARLRQWQNAALVLEERLKRYQRLLHAVPDADMAAVTAHVIGRGNRPFIDTMILDAGKRQGIKPGEAVVDERGLIGRVFLTGDHTSWVILLTDLNSRIPVVIEPGNIQAIMAGDNTSAPTLESSAQGAQPKNGEQIVTSGDGGLLPQGLPVGQVYFDGQSYRAALLADSATSGDVRILDLRSPPEQPPAPSASDLPVSAAGLAPLAPQTASAPAVVTPKPVPATPKPVASERAEPNQGAAPRQNSASQAPAPDQGDVQDR
jgi:rod shape-determining protein MreC